MLSVLVKVFKIQNGDLKYWGRTEDGSETVFNLVFVVKKCSEHQIAARLRQPRDSTISTIHQKIPVSLRCK